MWFKAFKCYAKFKKYYVAWWKPLSIVFSAIASIFLYRDTIIASFVGQAMKYIFFTILHILFAPFLLVGHILFIFVKIILLIAGAIFVLDLLFKTSFVKQASAECLKALKYSAKFKEYAPTGLKPRIVFLTVAYILFALFWFAPNILLQVGNS